ncbi:MAG: hypothetical protein LH702_18445 [Phormidesmis sp. CAN_BIN44]|nr:hypothetical protein [Phormidesmis sp. CAN_BIN44]
MSRGFGVTQPKRRNPKKPLEPKAQAFNTHQPNAKIRIQPSLEEDWHVNVEKQASAWQAGVYNPLANLDPEQVRSLDADEEEWLFLARTIGWLQVDDELDAIYFTAPPPAFAKTQADWYLRPDLTIFIAEPILLKEVMSSRLIPPELVNKAIARQVKRLKWNLQKTANFIQEVTGKLSTELTNEDYAAVLLEFQHL